MSFEKIDITDNIKRQGRSCIIIYNFNNKELKLIKNFANILGIKDQILVNEKNGQSLIKDILNDNIIATDNQGIKQKAIIFNAVSPAKISVFIENLQKVRINNSLVATVTNTSKEWTLNNLIENLISERTAIKEGKITNH